MKKILLSAIALSTLSVSAFAHWDFSFPKYVKVDKTTPIFEYKEIIRVVTDCQFSLKQIKTDCTSDARVVNGNISGKLTDEMKERYYPIKTTVYKDANSNQCFNLKEIKTCAELEQKDYAKVIKSYKNTAYFDGKTYSEINDEEKCFLKVPKNKMKVYGIEK